VRPYVEFGAAEIILKSPGEESNESSNFLLEAGHVVFCGDEGYIVSSLRYYYDTNVTDEQLGTADDVLLSLGRYDCM
jgi:hypothetical protein